MIDSARDWRKQAAGIAGCLALCLGVAGWGGPARAGASSAVAAGSLPRRAAPVAVAPRIDGRAVVAAHATYDLVPLNFEAAGSGVFAARGAGYAVYVGANDASLLLGGGRADARTGHGATSAALVRLHLVGANPRPAIAGEDRQQGTVNYFSGTSRRSWLHGLPTYAAVSLAGIYPGVDLRYYGTQDRLEYDFRLAPGASVRSIRQDVGGVDGLRIMRGGALEMAVAHGRVLRWARPVAYQVTPGGARRAVSVAYQLLGGHTFGFTLGRYDRSRPLVIDPVLTYSTFYGTDDVITAIALDSSDNVYVAGYTVSTIITMTHMLQLNRVPTFCPSGSSTPCADAFVAKISADSHRLVYSTYLGGGANDYATGIAVDSHGSAYVAGYTNSGVNQPTFSGPGFPVTSRAFQKVNHGGYDAFITKLSPNGQSLLYSTYLGGSTDNADTVGDDAATGIAVDQHGDAYVTGYTYSYNFPLKNPMQGSLGYGKGTLGTQIDAFVTKLNASGSGLIYSTYLGGSGSDTATGIAVDRRGDAYVTGQTNSPDFPTPPHALQAHLYGTDFNSFVAKINPAGSALVYSTYLGQTAGDKTHGIAVDSFGNVYVVGETTGGIPRTVGVPQPTSGGGIDAFVAKLSDRGVLVYSTYLGGTGDDIGYGIALDPAGDAYVTGSTGSAAFNTPVFPLKGALQGVLGGNRGGFGMLDAFVAKINSCGNALLYSSYLGGTFVDSGQAIAVDAHGNAYVAGQSLSPNFPISHPLVGGGAYEPPTGNAFVAKISGSPGSSSTACPLPLTVDVPPQASVSAPVTITVHTEPHALVTASLVVTNTVPPAAVPTPVAGSKKGPKPPKLGAVLYHLVIHGKADSYGLYVGEFHVKYAVTAPATVPAMVRIVTVHGRAAVATSVPVQLTA